MLESIPGSVTAEKVLLYLQNYEQGHGRGIAAAFRLAQSQVQKQLRKLESGGVLVSRLAGRTRIYEWNLRNVLVPPLRSLLQAALEALPPADYPEVGGSRLGAGRGELAIWEPEKLARRAVRFSDF